MEQARKVFAAYPEFTRGLLPHTRGSYPLFPKRHGIDFDSPFEEYDALEIYARTPEAAQFFREAYVKGGRLPAERAMVGLSAASGPRFTGELLHHLGTPNRRLAAIAALGVGRDPRAVPHLLRIATEPGPEACFSPEIRYAVHALDALERLGPVALPALHRAVEGKDASLRQAAILALCRIGDTRSISLLTNALRTEMEGGTRLYVVCTLAKMGDERVLPELLKMLEKEYPPHEDAARALAGLHRDPRALALLRQWAMEGETGCAEYARLGYTDLREHWEANLHRGWGNRFAEGLGELRDPRSIPALMKEMERREDGDVMMALVQIGKPAIPYLIPLLDSEDSDLAARAAGALGMIGDPVALPHLNKLGRRWPSDVRFAKLNIVLANVARKVRVP